MNIKLQTNEQLSATVANGLAGVFVNGVSLSASLSSKADLTALQNCYTKSETSSSSEISNTLANYYTKSETSSSNEISTAFENASGKVYFDNRISGVTGSNDLSVVKLSADEYAQMLDDGTCLSNAIYIVDAPNIDAFRRQIKNVASPTDLSDAATKGYVDNKVSSIQIPTDLSAFTNSPGYLSAHQSLSNYYQKSETSSADEISNALSAKADLSSIEHIVQYEEDIDGNYTAVTIGSRDPNASVGPNSFVNGRNSLATGYYSHAEGYETYAAAYAHAEGGFTRADGPVSHVEGIKAVSELSDFQSFVWQGTDVMPQDMSQIDPTDWDEYKAHGPGTFNINPVSGAYGFYIGEDSFGNVLEQAENNVYQAINDLSDTYQEKGNYLSSVPNDYKTYDATVSSLSSDGYLMSADMQSAIGDIQTSLFQSIQNPQASVRSIQETLISVLNILKKIQGNN